MRGDSRTILVGSVAAINMTVTCFLGITPAQAASAAAVRVPCSVTALVLAMSSISSGEELSLAQNCTYRLTEGLPVVSEDLTISGNGSTLERSYAPGTPAFAILQSNAAFLTVSRLSFRNGNGAIAMGRGDLTVNGGTFTGNTATDGGAISESFSRNDAPVVSHATFIDNRATDSGGAIYDVVPDILGLQVTDCVFIGNEAANLGGAVEDDSGAANVVGSVFRGNRGAGGGAVFLTAGFVSILSHDVFAGNSSIGDGGAIFSQGGLSIDKSKISGNHAAGTGGGLFLSLGGSGASAVDTEFTGNSATDGGAIGNLGQLSMDLEDVTILGNHARVDGGAIYNESFFTTETTQIIGNGAGSGGGGVYDTGGFATPVLTNSSVRDNNPDNCEPLGSIPGCTG